MVVAMPFLFSKNREQRIKPFCIIRNLETSYDNLILSATSIARNGAKLLITKKRNLDKVYKLVYVAGRFE